MSSRTLPSIYNRIPTTEEEFGIHYDPTHDYSLLPNGEAFGNCGNVAHYLQTLLNQGEVVGFYVTDNPSVICRELHFCGGHPFLLLERRWLVDLWISLFAGLTPQRIFDLQSPSDHTHIRHYFGDPQCWDRWNDDHWQLHFLFKSKA